VGEELAGFERRVNAVLKAVSEGARTPVDIARKTGLSLRETLVVLGFLEATRRIELSSLERCDCARCELRSSCPIRG
jgi:hypothetical protein